MGFGELNEYLSFFWGLSSMHSSWTCPAGMDFSILSEALLVDVKTTNEAIERKLHTDAPLRSP